MVHGKKGFERIVWACKNVLVDAVSWLFYDFGKGNGEATARERAFLKKIQRQMNASLFEQSESGEVPLAQHHPSTKSIPPIKTEVMSVLVPPLDEPLKSTSSTAFEDEAVDLLEWLGLVALESPRVQHNDSVDPYLCRYGIPNEDRAVNSDLTKVRWSGLIPAPWIRSLFIECL